VIASADANDRLALPSDGPRLDRKQWRTKPSLAPELQLILDRIKSLAAGGLTSMHVIGDFLKRRIAPLQQRARLCCWFTGSNDIGRIQRGPRTDLSWEELEVLVKGITGESIIPKLLILPEGIPALCDDAGSRSVNLAKLPTLDERGVAVRQTGGRDPHREIQISDAPVGGPQTAGMAPSAPAGAAHVPVVAPTPWTRAKGLQVAPPPQAALGCWRRKGDVGCAALTDRLFWTPPPRLGPRRPAPKSVRGPLAGPRSPAPRPRAHRGTLVLCHHSHWVRRHHSHWVRRHHNHHHRRARRRQQHLGMVSPRGTSSSSRNSGRSASRVAGRSRAPSEWSPFFD
jgi:hypothetical protein